MFFILIVGVVVVVVVVLGLSMCRAAALSDRNQAVVITERLATGHFADRRMAPADRPGQQFLFDPRDEAFRAAGWR
jgi:hypothetical protein